MKRTLFLLNLLFILWNAGNCQVFFEPGGDWELSSTPPEFRFPGSDPYTSGLNRAKLAWYTIATDYYFQYSGLQFPVQDLSRHETRQVRKEELLFDPNQPAGLNLESTLDLHYLPTQRGPYNYEGFGSDYSAGIDSTGKLRSPETRWAGITRALKDPNLREQGILFLDFWLMDPYDSTRGNPQHTGGELVFHLGEVSEDILPDFRLSFEGFSRKVPTGVDTTYWAKVSNQPPYAYSFPETFSGRLLQDVGLDGLNDQEELHFFQDRIFNPLLGKINFEEVMKLYRDPSGDDFMYFDDESLEGASILDRYLYINGTDKNSIGTELPLRFSDDLDPFPDTEDLSGDSVLNTAENYIEFRIPVRPGPEMQEGVNHIVEVRTAEITLYNGTEEEIRWYHYQIPLNFPDSVVGFPAGLDYVPYCRMYLAGWEEEVVLRMARSELLNIGQPGEPQEPLPRVRPKAKVYPNPTRDYFHVEVVTWEHGGPFTFKLYDLAGKLVGNWEKGDLDDKKFTIEVPGQAAGLYLYRLEDRVGSLVQQGRILLR